MRAKTAVLVLALAPLLPALAGDPPAVRALLKDITLRDVRFCQYGEEEVVREGHPFPVGSISVVPLFGPDGLELTWTDAGRHCSAPISEVHETQTIAIRTVDRTTRLLVHRDRFGRLYRGNPAAKTATIAGRKLVFIDRDFDGLHLEKDVDAFGLLDARHVVPLQSALVLGSRRVSLGSYDPGNSSVLLTETPLGTSLTQGARKILENLNDERLFHGLVTSDLDDEISVRYCQPHADWMAANRLCAHEQSGSTPRASAEGAIAGKASILSPPGPWSPAISWFDSPVHGYQVAAPDFTRTAVAEREGYSVLWVFGGHHGLKWPTVAARFPAVFPPHEAMDVPVSWWDEIGDPRQGDPSVDWGYPIRVYQGPGALGNYGEYPEEVKVTLRAEGASEGEMLQIVARPDDIPAGVPGHSAYVKFLVLPCKPLAGRTLYRLEMSWFLGGRPFHWQSTFQTGTARGQRRPPRSPE